MEEEEVVVVMRRGDVVCGGLVLTCHVGGGQTANK